MKHHNEIIPKPGPRKIKKMGTIVIVIALCSIATYAVWLVLQQPDSTETKKNITQHSIEYYPKKPETTRK